MLNIVIIGAGEIGRYIASLLSKEQHNIILVDKDLRKLQEASFHMDIATRLGSGTDWQFLDGLLDLSPDLLLALTDNDEVNLTSCALAKNLGYGRTVARVKDSRYLNHNRLDFSRIFDVDSFISPEVVVANDILKYLLNPGSLTIETFAHGAVQMRTLRVPKEWKNFHTPLKSLTLPEKVILGLIKRNLDVQEDQEDREEIIFPHGEDYILPGDEVTLIGEFDAMMHAHQFFGLEVKRIRSVVIIGGSRTGISLAKALEAQGIEVRLIEKNYEHCVKLAEILPMCTILNHDGTDGDFFRSEKIGLSDVIVTCTRNDEVNLLSAMLGKEVGCDQGIAVLANTSYAPLVGRLGIDFVLAPRMSAANHILSQINLTTVSSLVSLYNNQAEVMEIKVPLNSKIVGIPLSELGPILPKDFLITIIQNRGKVMVAHGDRIISPGDTVIAMTRTKYLNELETIF